jgi:putative glutamine amidotransferase
MTDPLIGVTTYRLATRYGFQAHAVSEKYIQALADAGAAPVLIPLGLSEAQLARIYASLDGILFTGGGDIHPRFYGAPYDEQIYMLDEDRDRVELSLFQHTMEAQLPFFGICRGFQLVNVGLGGSLYTDILAQHPGAQRHDFYPDFPRDLLAHPVTLVNGSRLAKILGDGQVQVNSLHHQGVRQLAPGLVASAYAPDGMIEALELPGYPFGMAVQWHPEWLQEHPPMRRLFAQFVQACSQ